MATKAEWLARRPMFTLLLNGYFGVGKSLQALSFPKCYVLSLDPAGLEPLRQPKNQKFLDNLVEVAELGRLDQNDLRLLFKEDPKEQNSVYGCIERAKELAASGEVETLVVDGGTYLVDLLWAKINELEQVKSEKTGNLDTQAMYRNLGLKLYQLFAANFLTTASRSNINLVCTFHIKRESEEQMQGNPKKARKLMLNSDLALQIEGGFRNKIEGLFGGSLYLEKVFKKDGDRSTYQYNAICDIEKAFQTTVMAKNRWGLPPRVSLDSKTLYEVLIETLALKKMPAATNK